MFSLSRLLISNCIRNVFINSKLFHNFNFSFVFTDGYKLSQHMENNFPIICTCTCFFFIIIIIVILYPSDPRMSRIFAYY